MAKVAVVNPLVTFPAYCGPVDFDVIVRSVNFKMPDTWEVTVKIGDYWKSRKFSMTAGEHTDGEVHEIAIGIAQDILGTFKHKT